MLGVHRARQGEGALEGAVAPLVAVPPLVLVLGDLLLLAADREDVVLEVDLHVLGTHAGELEGDLELILVLDDVARRHPRRRDRAPVPAAEGLIHHPVEPVEAGEQFGRGLGRAPGGCEEHPCLPPLCVGARLEAATRRSLFAAGGSAATVPRAGGEIRSFWQTGWPKWASVSVEVAMVMPDPGSGASPSPPGSRAVRRPEAPG